ncbi:hypothetical protein Y032_0447g1630 [Ancylostoma ceylanicum]|uniref:Uncharacterized protein n=1 Tax=Ancylostoma ceylanicum TaxID=53326 RepID=A0A016X0S8_9BILA|nr:hypothetical protein Y032_0447g1630 [Ancylostoma ceylanicum]
MSLLDKAEKSTLEQGVAILSFHLLSLVIHIILRFYTPADASYLTLSHIEIATSTTIQLAIPLTTLAYSKEIREASQRLTECKPAINSLS